MIANRTLKCNAVKKERQMNSDEDKISIDIWLCHIIPDTKTILIWH